MLINLQSAPEPDAKLPASSVPAPRVMVRQTDNGQVVEPVLNEGADLDYFHAAFLAAFATTTSTVAEALFGQLLNGLHTEPGKQVDSAVANLALALMHEIGPKDVVEAMLAIEMIVAHFAVMDTARRALHAEQTAGGRQAYLSLSRKLMTLFTAQMDALNRHRGKVTVQKVIVEKIHVAPSGQAIVGIARPVTTEAGG